MDYPREDFGKRVDAVQHWLISYHPGAGRILSPFAEFVRTHTPDDWQELHTRTFDVQAITTLDLGYLLFGDDYKRAELLVNLSREHTRAGNDCGVELADHLANVIRLLALMDESAIRNDLVNQLVIPALTKMIGEFDPMNLRKKNDVYERHHKTLIDMPAEYGTLYERPLCALREVVRHEFGIVAEGEAAPNSFITSLHTEMKLED